MFTAEKCEGPVKSRGEAMRVTRADLNTLRAAIEPRDTEENRNLYRGHRFGNVDRVKDLDMRYRWDLYWRVHGHTLIAASDYLDAHIDTALRAIVEPLAETAKNVDGHCGACIAEASEVVRDQMIGDIVEGTGIDWDVAARRVTDTDVAAAVTTYLDGIIAQQRQTLSSHPENTCFFVHVSD